jgi:nitroreductase
MTIHELLLKRFATKKFDATKKVSQEDLEAILEAARLSCSSANIQPWSIVVVTNPELRGKLREASYGQPQVTDASHLLVITSVKNPTAHIQRTAELIREAASQESADAYTKMVMGWVRPSEQENLLWCQKQTYLALQAMMLVAAEKGIDSCPMEGFDPAKVTELLGFTDRVATTLLPIGYALEPGLPKVRLPLAEIVEYRA